MCMQPNVLEQTYGYKCICCFRSEVTLSGSSYHSNQGEDDHGYSYGLHGSPAHSISESTPTHTEYTEGTPSFTTSSPSCSSDVLGRRSPSPLSPSNLTYDYMLLSGQTKY